MSDSDLIKWQGTSLGSPVMDNRVAYRIREHPKCSKRKFTDNLFIVSQIHHSIELECNICYETLKIISNA